MAKAAPTTEFVFFRHYKKVVHWLLLSHCAYLSHNSNSGGSQPKHDFLILFLAEFIKLYSDKTQLLHQKKALNNFMTLNLKKIVGWAIASFLILGLIYIIYIRHEFEHNYKVVTGKVIEITTSRHSDYSLIYTFEVNHKKYFGNTDLNLCGIIKIGDVKYFTLNKLFPIAYDTLSPSASSLIISLSSAEHFKYKMPDSLYPCLRHLDCDYYLNVTPEDYSK